MTFYKNTKRAQDFNAVALTIASPEQVLDWSHGEVTKPETINYRTQKPERDGLFCEKIFGPTKNYECYCGKYKRVRYKGVVCERCGVEVTRAIVRRERMGHIDLAVPVSHIWYLRSTPSRIGLLLDLPVKTLEQIVYFAAYIITDVDQEEKDTALEEFDADFKAHKKQEKDEIQKELNEAKLKVKSGEMTEKQLEAFESEQADKIEQLELSYANTRDDLEKLEVGNVLGELEYRELSMKFGHVFTAGTGAEALRSMLEKLDLPVFVEELKEEMKNSSGQKQKKLLKRIRLAASLHQSKIRPEWMILTRLPILPPDLRPMIQLDGGRFAASDLNDLYRRVINRNNRLRRLMQLGAPEVICRNEKRMLQEAIDTLLNNSPRAGRSAFTAGDRRRLKSLSDMLKGKQGRFRQNLLGKRVDYSGRSVIVVGPELELHQCGLPKEMAMKLFKPFVVGVLIREEYAYNVKGAERMIQANKKVVWDILDQVTKGRYVMLNRAPTLHRLGIQAFEPVLIEGKAIQLHPLVCAAFNADFDGDQMAVHLPISEEAQKEAREIICARNNILKPSSGQPIVGPSQDMILGAYYLTNSHEGLNGEGMAFRNLSDAINAYRMGEVDLQAKVQIRVKTGEQDGQDVIELMETTVGRAIFNSFVPVEAIGYQNKTLKKKDLENLLAEVFYKTNTERTATFADDVKRIGFKFATKSGLSISAFDLHVPAEKEGIIAESETEIKKINKFYDQGVITDDERYVHTIKIWAQTKQDVAKKMVDVYEKDELNHIYYMIDSGARGNWGQITQLSGMKGLVANPGGRTIELPIKSNLLEGFTILEYFNATHGGRKGKSDTALKTAEAGYLTRRLVDAVQDLIVKEEDCGTDEGVRVTRKESDEIGEAFENKIYGRTLLKDMTDSKGNVLIKAGENLDRDAIKLVEKSDIEEVHVRSLITCQTENGVCQKCYGRDLAYDNEAEIGTPVGIIAAQAIGEPGTQLTMRTFHSGGVAEGADITQGLTRVEELFEARPPKTPASLSEIAGRVSIHMGDDGIDVHVTAEELGTDIYRVGSNYEPVVKKGEQIRDKQIIARSTIDKNIIRAKVAGAVTEVEGKEISIKHAEKQTRIYKFKQTDSLKVENGDYVEAGAPLSVGHFNLRELIEATDELTCQKYILREVQTIYASQGQSINDKHLELIVKQMFSKMKIIDPGNSRFLPGEIVDYQRYINTNKELVAEDKYPAKGERLLLGLTRVSLATDSWLSAASFQETIRVLVEASITRKVDSLDGLKENVIIGKAIPVGAVYRKKQEELNNPTVADAAEEVDAMAESLKDLSEAA